MREICVFIYILSWSARRSSLSQCSLMTLLHIKQKLVKRIISCGKHYAFTGYITSKNEQWINKYLLAYRSSETPLPSFSFFPLRVKEWLKLYFKSWKCFLQTLTNLFTVLTLFPACPNFPGGPSWPLFPWKIGKVYKTLEINRAPEELIEQLKKTEWM